MQNQEQKEMKLRQEQKFKKKFKKQNHFLKKNKIDNSLANLRKIRDCSNKKNEKDIAINTTEMQRIRRCCYKLLYTN